MGRVENGWAQYCLPIAHAVSGARSRGLIHDSGDPRMGVMPAMLQVEISSARSHQQPSPLVPLFF